MKPPSSDQYSGIPFDGWEKFKEGFSQDELDSIGFRCELLSWDEASVALQLKILGESTIQKLISPRCITKHWEIPEKSAIRVWKTLRDPKFIGSDGRSNSNETKCWDFRDVFSNEVLNTVRFRCDLLSSDETSIALQLKMMGDDAAQKLDFPTGIRFHWRVEKESAYRIWEVVRL